MSPWLKSRRKIAAVSIVTILVGARLVVPITPAGDWMGPLTKCACGMYSFDRFQNGHIVSYGHGGEADDSPRAIGSYTKVGWNVYRWDAPWNTTGPITIRPGWFFIRYEGIHGAGSDWCWRHLLFAKANRIVRESGALVQVKHNKKKTDDDL
jgi:hypothetical protein